MLDSRRYAVAMSQTLSLIEAAWGMQSGDVVAYPTEAVWGLGCDPFDENAVMRLLAIKERPLEKGLILVAGAVDQFEGLLDWESLPQERRDEVLTSWPGPHTWIVPATSRVPRWIRICSNGSMASASAKPVDWRHPPTSATPVRVRCCAPDTAATRPTSP